MQYDNIHEIKKKKKKKKEHLKNAKINHINLK